MQAVILDAATLGNADLSSILSNGDNWQVFDQTMPSEVEERIQGADIVLTNKVPIQRSAMESSEVLKLVMITATGTNNVDLNAADQLGKIVCNVRGYGSASVAQHSLTMMLNLATKMPLYLDDVREGEWHRRGQVTLIHRPIFELAGKRLGIIGYGQLGQAVAQIAKAFGMEVVRAARPGEASNGDRIAISELLPTLDFLSLHCPLDDQNHHLINEDALNLMPNHSYLINTARGSLVDSEALVNALVNQSIAGAAVDVLPIEPPEEEDILLRAQKSLPNLLITPHNAWGALESRQRLVNQVADIIESFHQGEPLNQVT